MARQGRQQVGQGGFRICDDAYFRVGDIADLRRVDIDADDFQVIIQSPLQLRDIQSCPYRQDHVCIGPEPVCGAVWLAEVMAVVDNALAASTTSCRGPAGLAPPATVPVRHPRSRGRLRLTGCWPCRAGGLPPLPRSGSPCGGSGTGEAGSNSTSSCRPMMSGDISRATGRIPPGVQFPEGTVDEARRVGRCFYTVPPILSGVAGCPVDRVFRAGSRLPCLSIATGFARPGTAPVRSPRRRYTGPTWYSACPVRGRRNKRPSCPWNGHSRKPCKQRPVRGGS